MGKKTKMTYESALENQKKLKADIKEKTTEIKDFKKENKVTSKNPATGKVLKSLESLEKKLETAKESLSKTNAFIKENKPAKESKERNTKYAYPEWCKTSDQRKKYRTIARSGTPESEITEKMVEEGKRAVGANFKKDKADKPKKDKKSKKKEATEEEATDDVKAPVKKKKSKKKSKSKKKTDDD